MDFYRYLVFPQKQLIDLKAEYWLRNNVFSLVWWLMLFFLITPWILWWRLVDKKRIKEIFLHGTFIIFFSSLFDNIGLQLNLWGYRYLLTPISQYFEPYDFSVLPVLYMLIYQKYPNWKHFITAQFIASAVISFAVEPLTAYFGIYKILNWRFEYSFFIYPLIGIMSKIINNKFNKIEGSK